MISFSKSIEPGTVRNILFGTVVIPFCWCPPGRFLMGDPDENEPLKLVIIENGFWIQQTPFIQEMLQIVAEHDVNNYSVFSGKNCPVDNINWYECVEICKKINMLNSSESGIQFCLPTEQEWEYACRAGTTTPFSFGEVLNGYQANHFGNSPYGTKEKGPSVNRTTPVRTYLPNTWNIYDMHGNVWEWCSDYEGKQVNVNGYMPRAMIKGGSWFDTAYACKSGFRVSAYLNEPTSKSDPLSGRFGFRLVLKLK